MLLSESSPCPLRFPRRPFCWPQDKSSAKKANTSLLPRHSETMESEKKATQHLCLLRFKHAAFFALPSTFSPRSSPKVTLPRKTRSWQAANSLGRRSWQHIKKKKIRIFSGVFELLCGVISGRALAHAEWSALCDMGVRATQTSAGCDSQ